MKYKSEEFYFDNKSRIYKPILSPSTWATHDCKRYWKGNKNVQLYDYTFPEYLEYVKSKGLKPSEYETIKGMLNSIDDEMNEMGRNILKTKRRKL